MAAEQNEIKNLSTEALKHFIQQMDEDLAENRGKEELCTQLKHYLNKQLHHLNIEIRNTTVLRLSYEAELNKRVRA